MLKPPLSVLSDDLLDYIVEHVSNLPRGKTDLYYLSLADRAFTRSCQERMFKDLHFGYDSGRKDTISEKLARIRKLLDYNPSYADRVRSLYLTISHNDNAWLFHDPTFTSIVQLLSKSPVPPHKLSLSGGWYPLILEDPIFVMARLTQSFFSQTLTTLHLVKCDDLPLTLFLVCPKLRDVLLDTVHITEESDAACSGEHCGTEPPALEHLLYRDSRELITQMLVPPPQFPAGVIRWSNIRTLALGASDVEEMTYLQRIVDAASHTLEELHVINLPKHWEKNHTVKAPFVPSLNLNNHSRLHIFSFDELLGNTKYTVIDPINAILSTIPASNKITALYFDFNIIGVYPYNAIRTENWDGLRDEVVRISGQKSLGFHIKGTAAGNLKFPTIMMKELYGHMSASLADHPNIFTHFCKPTAIR